MAQPQNVRNPLATDKVSVSAFAAGIKSKYPEYKDVDDNELVGAMIEKYPQYADQVEYYPSKKKDSMESPSTTAGEPTGLASQLQKESADLAGQQRPSEALAGVESDEPVDFFTSIANSAKNIGKNLSLLDDKLDVATDALFTAVLGKETADSWYKWTSENLWGENVNESAAKAIKEIERVESEMGETRGIIESAKKGDLAGIAAGTVDAVSSLAVSMIEAGLFYGVPLAVDMVGSSIANYNTEKAKASGMDSVQHWESDEAEILFPTITGALSYSLEKAGQLKLSKQLTGQLLGKKVVEKSTVAGSKFAATRFGKAFLSNPNREGMTEFMQGMIEQYSLADARGESFDALDYITSEEAWEQYVMGAVGAKVLDLGGKGANRLMYGTTARTAEKQELKEKILTAEEVIQDPETPADEKQELRKTQKEAAAKIQEIQAEEAEVLKDYSEEDKAELADIDRQLKKKEGILKRSKKEETKKIHKEAIESLVARKKEIEAKYGEPTEQVEQTEQEKFVETGEVSDETVTTIAEKVRDGQELTQEEQAIYQEKSQEVETKLQEFAKEEAPVETPVAEEAPKEAAPKKKATKKKAAPKAKQEEVTYRNTVYVVGEDGTITNKKSGKVIGPNSVTAKGVLKARKAEPTAAVEPVAEPTPKPVKETPKKVAPKKKEEPVKAVEPAKPKVDKNEVEAQKKVLDLAPRKKYEGLKSPLVKRKRGWVTVIEKTDKRSGKITRYEAEVFVNTKTGKVSHKITEFRNGKKVDTKSYDSIKSFRDAVNKRIAQGAVVPDSFQREFESKTEGVQEARDERAKLERVADYKEPKAKTYTVKRERITYENAKGDMVSAEITVNIGNRPSGTPYARIKYPNGDVKTFSSKQMLDGEMARFARRKNVKIETLSETKKDKEPSTQTTVGVAEGTIMPEFGKQFRIKKPKKGRKKRLPNNTKPYKPVVVRQATDFEPAVYRVYTPDGESIFFERQIDTNQFTQVERVTKDRYAAVEGAKGYDRLNQAVAEFRQEYEAEAEEAAKPAPKKPKAAKESPAEKPKVVSKAKDGSRTVYEINGKTYTLELSVDGSRYDLYNETDDVLIDSYDKKSDGLKQINRLQKTQKEEVETKDKYRNLLVKFQAIGGTYNLTKGDNEFVYFQTRRSGSRIVYEKIDPRFSNTPVGRLTIYDSEAKYLAAIKRMESKFKRIEDAEYKEQLKQDIEAFEKPSFKEVERKQLRPRLAIRLKSRDSKAQNSRGYRFSLIESSIQRANQILQVFAPDVVIITHSNSVEYAKAMDENARTPASERESARFIYNVNTGAREIHINTDFASPTTAVHEAFHAYYNTVFNSDPEAANKLAKELYRALKGGSKQDREIASRLMRFINLYEGKVKGEEFAAELAGIMSQTEGVLEQSTLKKIVNTIKKFVLDILDRAGVEGPFIDMFRADVQSDISQSEAIEFIKGFVSANRESIAAPEANRIADIKGRPVERKQLSEKEQEALDQATSVEQKQRAKLKSVKDVFPMLKGMMYNAAEMAKREGLFYTETQKKINKFLESMNSQLSRTSFRVRIQARTLRKLADTPEKLALVEDYLVAPAESKEELRKKIEKLDKGDRILAVADSMRAFIDAMSEKILTSPYFDSIPEVANKKVEAYKKKKKNGEEVTRYRIINTKTGKVIEADLTKTTAYKRAKERGLRDIIRENLGTYLHTSYRFFKDKNYKITDKSKKAAIEGQYEAVKAERLKQLIEEGKSEQEAVEILRSPEEVNKMMAQAKESIEQYIKEIEALRADPDFKYTGLSAKALEVPNRIFQRKKGLPEYIQNLLGKEKDPVVRFTDTATAMMQTLYKAQLVSKISDVLGTDYIKDTITDEEAASGNWKKVNDPYSPLDGKYVQSEVFEMLQSKPLLQSDQAIINYYFKGLKLMRKSKVVWNIPTWRKNWTGGWFFMATNGIINKNFISDTKNRAERLFNGMTNEDVELLLDEMAENGLIGADVTAGLIDLNDAALGMMFTEEDLNKYEGKLKKLHSKLKNADSRLAEKYASVDDYTKLVIYRVEKESFAKKLYGKEYSQLNESQQAKVRSEAAEFVKQNTPTFSRLPKWYTKGRFKGKEISFAQAPLGDFLGFKLESIRSMYANIKNAKEDLEKSKDKSLSDVQRAEYKKAGTRRMAGALSVLSMRMAIPTIFASIALDDDDEEIADDAVRLRPSWMEGHTLLVKSISDDGVVSVYDYSMEDPYAELTDPLIGDFSMFSDFLEPNMMVKLAVHLSEGKDAYGKDIYEEADGKVLKMAKVLGYTTKQMVVPPSLVALTKYKDPSQMAIRDYKIDIGQQFYFQAKEYVSKDKYTDLTGMARANRLAALDDVREMYQSVMRVALAKNNMKLALSANKVLNRFGAIEKNYILTGVEIKQN